VFKRVVLYLRKSRDESVDALEKHRAKLLRLCKEREYIIVEIFEEIVSGKTLRKRPEMLKLLDLLKRREAEAVMVVDLDRLGRGDLEEWGYVSKFFQSSRVKIITPDAIYDPTDPNQALILNIQSSVANFELTKITRRLKEGKVEGAIMGRWTNGKPPYPYKYVKSVQEIGPKEIIIGSVVVDEEKSEIYRKIIDCYMKDRLSTQEITMRLNQQGIPSPAGTQ
jgi:site-specific DNA recombinase